MRKIRTLIGGPRCRRDDHGNSLYYYIYKRVSAAFARVGECAYTFIYEGACMCACVIVNIVFFYTYIYIYVGGSYTRIHRIFVVCLEINSTWFPII